VERSLVMDEGMGEAMSVAQTSAKAQLMPEADPAFDILSKLHIRSSSCGFHSGGASEAGSDSFSSEG